MMRSSIWCAGAVFSWVWGWFIVATCCVLSAQAATITATYNTAADVPVTAGGYTATGNTVAFTLNFAPSPGTELNVIKNTGSSFISGVLDNLVQGQPVTLGYGGTTFTFVADYHGGSGNDLVLVWAINRALAWGYDSSGQLGDYAAADRSSPNPVFAKGILVGRTLLSLAAGDSHSLSLGDDGSLTAWGNNASGQLGNNSTNNSAIPIAVLIAGTPLEGRRIAALATGAAHNMVLCDDGTLAAWGYNAYGQLGDSTTSVRYFPTSVTTAGTPLAGRTVVAVAAGAYHTLALCADGTLAAWGLNVYGQLGDGTTVNRSLPVAVVTNGTPLAGRTVVAIAAGRHFSAALCSDGTVVTWGDNSSGQLGDSSTTGRLVPGAVTVSGTPLAGKSVAALVTGGNYCLVRCTDGTLVSWGHNGYGQLGDSTTTERHAPVAVVTTGTPLAAKTVTALAACSYHSLALCSDGTLAAWGRNNSGQLGDQTLLNRSTPVAVAPLSDGGRFTRIFSAANAFHTLALAAYPPAPEIAGFTGAGTASVNERESAVGTFAFTPTLVGASSAPQTFTLKNTGTADLTGLALTTAGAHATDFTLGPLGATNLAPGATTTFTVSFAPTVTGVRTAGVRIASNDSDENPFVINVTGANPEPEISVFNGASTAAFDERTSGVGSFTLDPVTVGGSGTARTFTIKNTGTASLTGLTVTSTGTNLGDFAAGAPAATTLAPGATITFTVTFTPTASGVRSASVQIASNDADENPFVVAVNGTGFVPGGIVSATYTTGLEIPVTAASYTASGKPLNVTLQFAPVAGTELRVVNNTGTAFITGTFAGLPQGQLIELDYAGTKYPFVANYYGGNGNDLVLVWAANQIYSWGLNGYGVLGDLSTTDRSVPVPVASSSPLFSKTVLSVIPGAYHALALCADGTLASWGSNGYGQLGNGSNTSRTAPGLVTTTGTPLTGRTVIAVAAGENHSLALCTDGTVVAWGENNSGQLGDNSTTDRLLPVAVVTAGTPLAGRTVVAIAAGAYHSLALCSDGTLVAWGQNNAGQLGDNSTTQRNLPVAVTISGTPLSGHTVTSLIAGGSHCLVLCSDGTLFAWGQNTNGQLGDNSTTARSTPVAVVTTGTPLAGRTIATVAAGGAHSLALCTDGTLAAWGWNTQGQVGDNSTTGRTLPTAVTITGTALAGKTAIALAAGSHHSLALCSDGTITAWGYNSSGQLGDGTTAQRQTAVAVSTTPLAANQRFARAATGGQSFLYSSALVAGPPVPEIAVFEGAGSLASNERQHNSGFVFAFSPPGSTSAVQIFTIKNTGSATLNGLAVTMIGSNPGDFPLDTTGVPTSLAPGASTSFNVTFSPISGGARSASVRIASNDADENPFVIQLSHTLPVGPQPGVISHWPLNENTGTTAADTGPANNPGTLSHVGTGTVAWTSGKVGSAVAFTGTGAASQNNAGFISAGNPASLDFDTTSSFSIATWMKVPPGSVQDSTLVGKMHQYTTAEPNHTGYELHYYCGGTTPGFSSRIIIWLINLYGTHHIEVASTIPVNDGNWHQIAFTYDGSGQASGVRIYVDGVVDPAPIIAANTLGTYSIRNSVNFNIGSRNDGAYHGYTGSIDDVQVYDHVLGGANMLTLFQNPGTVVVTGTPDISVFDGDGLERQSAIGSFAFTGVKTGTAGNVKTFTIQNVGTATLANLAVTKTGANPADFTLGTLGATTLAPGSTTSFTLTFVPSVTGSRSAVIQIASNDADENPFVIAIVGSGLTALQSWRQTQFGTAIASGSTADTADPDGDGVPNLLEYALGLDPSQANSTGLPVLRTDAGHLTLTFNRAAGATDLTYIVEATNNLTGNWTEIYSALGVTIADQVTATDPQPLTGTPRRFLRLRITSP